MRLIKHDNNVKITKIRDEKGRDAGVKVEHKDGRVHAVARPQPIKMKANVD